ncbi:MAG: oligoendopeptidase F [Gammaproteobacteria bacterium]|nr:oligoendopeptidase F [Gammaproteobacteria bacterium]MAY01932.1 oligoendopeptidase F [Gammaproteobacteria bacterium]
MATFILSFLLVLPALTACAQESEPERYEWDLTDLYASVDDWEAAFTDLQNRLQDVDDYRGTLGDSAQSMSEALGFISDSYKELTRMYIYTNLRRDADQRVAEEQTRFGRAMQLYTNWGEATSWLNPEILSVGTETVNRYIDEEPALADFEFMLQDILRMAPYTLDERTEEILAQASMMMSSPQQIYQMYANADIPWPTVTLSDGEEAELTQAGYTFYRGVENRDDRKLVFDTFWDTWQQYADGMGATLAGEVQANVFSARARNYDSVLQQNLFADGLPPEIYTQLVAQVNDALPIFHRYLELRGRMLGVEDLRYYDIYPPLVEVETGEFGIERSKEITFEALRPFGDEYLGLLEEGLAQDWMHSHPQAGKRSGAYMSGGAYDVHPYILLNHNDDYNSLSTFAHEWGHAVHTMLAKQDNPWETADYSTFTAEMASTINEILLEEYMIANAQTDEERLYYLGNALESIRGTFYRQTMFAEFELEIHETVESGEPLTGSSLSEIYGDLLKRYHGHDEGVLTIDDAYAVEWAYIPHFYLDFYVFQYATSITGAAWFAEKFLAGDVQVRDDFLDVLRAGGSDYPHNILLNEAGLDMTQAEAYEPVIRRMVSLMDRIEAILDAQG